MSKNKITIILIAVLFGVCGFAGFESLKNVSINEIAEKVYPVSCTVINEEEAKKIQNKVPIHLYYATKQNKLKLVVRYISNTKQDINEIATIIVEELMKAPKEQGLYNVIPNGTKLRKPVKVKDNIAYVDLSEEFIKNHKGGKEGERVTIFAIVNSLTELKDINRVNFRINGKILREYKGNFRFDKDFPRFVQKAQHI